ncbi:MAG: RecX family transcriptional regulator [Calditrichaceae bacterium]|nr:RecX family transcriptional regulator [Calditrichaceae bacterium]
MITKIEVQKKQKNYFNLYIEDDVYLFSVTEETLLHFGISKNKDFSDNELESIQSYDQKMRCVYQAYRYLTRRPHLNTELKRKLSAKKFSNSIIEQTLEYLNQKNYMDDEAFIKMYMQEQINLKKSGPLIIKKKLMEKGAHSSAIDPILTEGYPEELQIENAAKLFQNKIRSIREEDEKKVKEKMYRFLQQKGFTWPIIEKVFSGHFD